MLNSPALSTHHLGLPDLDGRYRFPVEIWEHIFNKMAGTELVATAAVCTLFNELCSKSNLFRNGIATDSVLAGNYKISSHLLPALQRSLYTPPILRLACRFPTSTGVLPGLKILAAIVSASPNLAELELRFATGDIFAGVKEATALKSLGIAFLDLVGAMSRQVQGPIIIVDELSVTVSRPGQVSWWEMDDCNFNLPVPAARPNPGALWARFNRERVEQQIVTGSKCVEEPTTHIPSHLSSISSIGSVNMRSLRSLPGGLGTSTLILANPNRSFWEMKSKHCSDKDISAILPHITFPNLRKISIDARPDPAILSAFLCRHPRIEEIDYLYGSFFSGLRSPSQTLIHPEVKLPALKAICSYRSWSLPALLRGLVLPSTIPISISVYYRRNTRRARALFLSTLEAIRMQTAEQPVRIVLLIFLHDKKFYTPQMTYNSREICAAQNLAAVDYICISTGHVDHARAFLPWLQHVPTLRNLTILMGKPAAQPAIDLLQEEATKELPACTIRIMNL